MPQSGFHALVGVALARRSEPGSAAWIAGVVVGAMLPDVDIMVTGILRAAGMEDAGIHRSATHSLLLVALRCLPRAASCGRCAERPAPSSPRVRWGC